MGILYHYIYICDIHNHTYVYNVYILGIYQYHWDTMVIYSRCEWVIMVFYGD